MRHQDITRPGLGYHLKVHTFRAFTVILAWALIVVFFYQDPGVLTGAQRAIQYGIEFVGDNVPAPWGPRLEFVFREIGGLVWLQITLLVLVLRIALSALAMLLRIFRRDRNGVPEMSHRDEL